MVVSIKYRGFRQMFPWTNPMIFGSVVSMMQSFDEMMALGLSRMLLVRHFITTPLRPWPSDGLQMWRVHRLLTQHNLDVKGFRHPDFWTMKLAVSTCFSTPLKRRGSECHVYGVFVVRFHFRDLLRHSLRTSFWLGAWWSWWFIHMVNHCWFIDMIWYGLIVVNYCMFLHFIACYYVNSLELFWILCLIIQSKLLLDHHQPLDMEFINHWLLDHH